MSCAGRDVSEILAAGRGVYISQYNRCREAKRIDGEIVGTTTGHIIIPGQDSITTVTMVMGWMEVMLAICLFVAVAKSGM